MTKDTSASGFSSNYTSPDSETASSSEPDAPSKEEVEFDKMMQEYSQAKPFRTVLTAKTEK